MFLDKKYDKPHYYSFIKKNLIIKKPKQMTL